MIDTRVKVCGVTSPDDARLSQALGADYIGLIFAQSRRRVTVDVASRIRVAVPNAILVGVFVDAPVDDVVETCRVSRVNLVQLHGSETPEYCGTLLTRMSLPIIKAFSSSQLDGADRLKDYDRISYFLFDLDKPEHRNRPPANPNGARTRLWNAASTARRRGYRVFLAGALDATNVRRAVEFVKPYCVDVASGVEKSPGVKDSESLARFIKEVRG